MKKRILIVDDEPKFIHSFKILLETKGYWVSTASNGIEAIELFKKNPLKIVITDLQMDKMDGVALMHQLKKLDPCVQIIFLTAYATMENAASVLRQNNAFDYISKPIKHYDHFFKNLIRARKIYDRKNQKLIQENKNITGLSIFENIFEAFEEAIYVSDMKTYELIYANKKFLETFNCKDIFSKPQKKCWEILQKRPQGPCPFCVVKQLLNPDGSIGSPHKWEYQNPVNDKYYSIIDKAILWHDNSIVHLQTAIDITEKKENETLFRQFEKAIETTKRLESISTMAGGVAHDFNNTLSTILGNINLAQLTANNIDTLKYLQNAEKGIIQAKNISSKLITFAKGGGPHKVKIDIEQIINKSVKEIIDSDKIEVILDTESIPDELYADEFQLGIAIKSILQNARDSILGLGRIEIIVRHLSENLLKPQISLTITDSGCGISPEHMDMIFNPYFTTEPLNSQKSKGLGLSIAWSIITRHCGNIHIESTLHHGTKVHIFLPLASSPTKRYMENDSSIPESTSAYGRQAQTVLIMEDDELTLDIMSQLLKKLGFIVYNSLDGSQALDLAQSVHDQGNQINLAILDLEIKNNLGGIPTLKKLKKIVPDIKSILISGHLENPDLTNFKKFNFDAMLKKPFSLKELNITIKDILPAD